MRAIVVILALMAQPASPALVPPQTAHLRIDQLNRERRFKIPLFGTVEVTQLSQRDARGIDLGNGARITFESTPKSGLVYTRDDEAMSAVGVASIEGHLQIDTVDLTPGEYVMFAGAAVLYLATETASRSVAHPVEEPDSPVAPGARQRDVPRVDVAVEDGSAYLLIADNRLQVRASPQRK